MANKRAGFPTFAIEDSPFSIQCRTAERCYSKADEGQTAVAHLQRRREELPCSVRQVYCVVRGGAARADGGALLPVDFEL